MKILYVTTIGGTMRFFTSFIKELVNEGHTVEIATNNTKSPVRPDYYEMGCPVHTISCSRSPLSRDNLKAYKELKKLIDENDYDIVHCHTPVAAMLTRLAARKARKRGIKVIYTAHGFHFYKGAPKLNWLIYYPIEWFCAFFTDTLLTMNEEDFKLAKKRLKASKVEYVPGVGIDPSKFERNTTAGIEKRRELGIPGDAKLLISIGELIKRKNHMCAIKAVKDLDVYYIIAGKGPLNDSLQTFIDQNGLSSRVKLLGFRKDIKELCSAADLFLFPSFHEGLPVSVMEAMASSLPIVCSEIRGSVDLVDEQGGAYFNPHSAESCKIAIEKMLESDMADMGRYNREKVQNFNIVTVNARMKEVYGL